MLRYDSGRAIQFMAFIADLAPLAVVPFDGDALGAAGRLVRKFADQRLTLADAYGLAIMAQRRTAACWSTDRHLGLTGAKLAL